MTTTTTATATATTTMTMTTAGARSARPRPVTVSPLSRPPARLLVVWLVVLVSCVAWRRGVYYSGGLDVVVAAKAALGVLALALAITAPRSGPAWSRLRAGPVPWIAVYLGVSVAGGLLHGTGFATAVLAARVMLITVTVVALVRAYPWPELLGSLTTAMLLLAGVGTVTGLGSLASSGRLYGGVPPLNANELSLLVGVPLVCLAWRCLNREARWWDVAAVPVLLAVVWLTGTRTGLVALLLAFALLVVMTARIPAALVVVGVLCLPVLLFVAFLTPLVSGYATRGDAAATLTLNSRTVAWEAAFHYADSGSAQLLGSGLAVKEIPVSALYRSEQILDSTWVSAVVQVGAVGTAVLALMVVLTLGRALTAAPPLRSLTVAVLALLVVRSALESGLFDASPAYVPFLCFALAVPSGRRASTVPTREPS
ncbi:O-antigen ligase family protein [Nocardioides sp.]|uniref:O-antigen ligase family protein n=1 Tax=Nocardioides sp. TaxID=35761 RepID=UPI002EDA5EE5